MLQVDLTSSNVDSLANDKTVGEEGHITIQKEGREEGFRSRKNSTFEEQVIAGSKPENSGEPGQTIKKEPRQYPVGPTGSGKRPLEQPRVQDHSQRLDDTRIDVQTVLETEGQSHVHNTGGSTDIPEDLNHDRKIPYQHQNVRVGRSPWTISTPRPKIDPHGFKDPLINSFYRDVWTAVAAHNVSSMRMHLVPACLILRTKRYRPKSSVRSSVAPRTIWLRRGSNTKSSTNTKKGLASLSREIQLQRPPVPKRLKHHRRQ